MTDENPLDTFSVLVARLNDYELGYLHVLETAQTSKGSSDQDLAMSASLRKLWKSLYVLNGGYDGLRGEEALRTGHADAVAYGPDHDRLQVSLRAQCISNGYSRPTHSLRTVPPEES